jgi:F-type H+-transporting ATPase subunit b
MTNWISLLLIANESEGFGINPDILETNVINILLLLALLFFTLGNSLRDNLANRQKKIINNVQDAEKRLNEANDRLVEAKTQWAQTQIVFDEIKIQNKQAKTNLLNADFVNANKDLALKFKTGLMLAEYREIQVFTEIFTQVAKATLERAIMKIKSHLNEADQALIVDSKINRLEGEQF